MNTLTQEDLANSNTPAAMFQSSQGALIPPGNPALYDPYAAQVAQATAVADGTQDAVNAAANAGATTGVPQGVMTQDGSGNTGFDAGGTSRGNWDGMGWPWGDETEQFPITTFGISGMGALGNQLGTIVDDTMAFATKPVSILGFNIPVWALAGGGVVAAVSLGFMKNPLKKGKKK